MSLKILIEAAHNSNPSKFEKTFEAIISEKLVEALEYKKATIVAEMFNIDLAEQELTEEEYQLIAEDLSELSEEELEIVAEMEILEAAEFITERFQKKKTLGRAVTRGAKRGAAIGGVGGAAVGAATGAKMGAAMGGILGGPGGAAAGAVAGGAIGMAKGALTGGAGGAAAGAATGAAYHGARKLGRGVKKVAKKLVGRK